MMSVPTAIGLPDVANRALTDIKSRNELVRAKGTKALATFLEAEIREISGEKLSKLLGELNKRIGDLVSSIDVHEKLGGIEAIDTLLEIDCDEAMSQGAFVCFLCGLLCGLTFTCSFLFCESLAAHVSVCRRSGRARAPALSSAFVSHSFLQTMVMGSRALGHLAAKGGAVIADTIDFEIKRALEGLTGERQENRRLASVLVLKELAKNAPTLFNVYVAEFFDKIWTALRDPKEQVRSGAVDALRACLTLILERQSSMRVQWYYKIYDEAIKGLRQSSPENIHGSLLTIGELLRSTGDFLSTRFKDICDWVRKNPFRFCFLVVDLQVLSFMRLLPGSQIQRSQGLPSPQDHYLPRARSGWFQPPSLYSVTPSALRNSHAHRHEKG
jgi:FKBP12-rapamycin complex-associated protein